MKKILIYGTGNMAKKYAEQIDSKFDIISFVETVKEKEFFLEKPVIAINEIMNLNFDEMHIVNNHVETILNSKEAGIETDKIYVIMNESRLYSEHNIFFEYLKLNHYICDVHFNAELVVGCPMLFKTMAPYTKKINFFGTQLFFNKDYVRWQEFQLLADEININRIDGDCAELGVYQGQFAKLINEKFPKRKLYLFDTFQGFSEKDICSEETFNDSNIFVGQLGDTSIKKVIEKMKYPEQIIICEGWFPLTIPSKEIKYAFVSLDCDLYAPILAGLEYFYPRLTKGGVYNGT